MPDRRSRTTDDDQGRYDGRDQGQRDRSRPNPPRWWPTRTRGGDRGTDEQTGQGRPDQGRQQDQGWPQDQGDRAQNSAPAAPTAPPAGTPAPATATAARGRTAGYNEGNPGTCVFYALDRFHQVTGVYPYAFGDALLLADGAAASGWNVSSTPRVNSVAIFQPGQNGATAPTGHATWVEQVTSDGQIYVSEWNAPLPFTTTRRWLTPARGVRFIYT